MPREIVITECHEAKRVADELIPRHHPHLLDARILYLKTTAERKKCDRVRLASAAKLGALQKYLSSLHMDARQEASIYRGADFLMLIGEVEWGQLSTTQRVALVDHELLHMKRVEKITDTGVEASWGLRGHTVEAFAEEIERHGLWKSDLRVMAEVMQQRVPLEPAEVRV